MMCCIGLSMHNVWALFMKTEADVAEVFPYSLVWKHNPFSYRLYCLTWCISAIFSEYGQFSCNAHTICDAELKPLGTGLYPVVSIINHR